MLVGYSLSQVQYWMIERDRAVCWMAKTRGRVRKGWRKHLDYAIQQLGTLERMLS